MVWFRIVVVVVSFRGAFPGEKKATVLHRHLSDGQAYYHDNQTSLGIIILFIRIIRIFITIILTLHD